MKKIGLLFIFLIVGSVAVFACDICGCGVSSYYNGILPDFRKRIIGVRYRYNSLKTHIGVGGVESYLTTNEVYRSAEIWTGWNLGNRFRVMASIPYSFNERRNQSGTTNKDGIGDISLTGYYQLFKSERSFNNWLLNQSLWIGGGIKLPTGQYNPAEKQGSTQSTNLFQLGTGSVDYMLNAMYDIRLQDAGLNLNASYKTNNANNYHYQYGNKLSSSAQAYYKLRPLHNLSIAPNVGVVYETANADVSNGLLVDVSGGQVLLGTLGLEVAYNQIAIGCNWQSPLTQNLANGFVKTNNRLMLHVSVAL